METLKQMNFNFNTVENGIKTLGTLLIVVFGIALTVNMILNPVEFTF